MSGAEVGPIVALLLSLAPPDWLAMRVVYRYDNALAMAATEPYTVTPDSKQQWVRVSYGGFEMMDLFDAYREKTYSKMDKPWTTVTVTVMRENQEPVVEFGYDAPNILQR
jgi:hypothetical protein